MQIPVHTTQCKRGHVHTNTYENYAISCVCMCMWMCSVSVYVCVGAITFHFWKASHEKPVWQRAGMAYVCSRVRVYVCVHARKSATMMG